MQLSSVQKLLLVRFTYSVGCRTARQAARPILSILDDFGKPFHPNAEVKSQLKPNSQLVKERPRIKDAKQSFHDNYVKQVALNAIRQPLFFDGIKYARIDQNHRDFIETKLVRARFPSVRKKLIILEGKRLINDAIKSGVVAQKIFFSDAALLKSLHDPQKLFDDGTRFYQIKEFMMRKVSLVTTPPGLLGVFFRSCEAETASRGASFPINLIADNIRDPGNLGSLIRSAAAVGAENVICTKGCVDPWSHKVVNAGCGAHFRINIVDNFEWKNLTQYLPLTESTLLFATKLDSDCNPSEETQQNLPPSIRRLRKSNYYELDYRPFKKDKLLGVVIGGETHGISREAFEATEGHLKYLLSVPLFKGIESLNSAVAGSIILFEIQRQILAS